MLLLQFLSRNAILVRDWHAFFYLSLCVYGCDINYLAIQTYSKWPLSMLLIEFEKSFRWSPACFRPLKLLCRWLRHEIFSYTNLFKMTVEYSGFMCVNITYRRCTVKLNSTLRSVVFVQYVWCNTVRSTVRTLVILATPTVVSRLTQWVYFFSTVWRYSRLLFGP